MWCAVEEKKTKQKMALNNPAELTIRVQSFLYLLTQGGEARGLQLEFVFVDRPPRSLHTISSLSRRHTGACDQPLQNLQRIHYHVSGCSASRDHVPIPYDILYWGGGGLVVVVAAAGALCGASRKQK